MINKSIIKLLDSKEIKKIGDINLQARPSELSAEVYYKITELYESR